MSLSVRAVERALDILLSFTSEEPVRSLAQIAASVHLSKPTAHRLLATLEKKRFIAKDKISGRYRLDIQLNGQPGSLSCSSFAQSSGSIHKSDGDRDVVINLVAATIPKDPQASTGLNRIA
jgi:hypothetical protein